MLGLKSGLAYEFVTTNDNSILEIDALISEL